MSEEIEDNFEEEKEDNFEEDFTEDYNNSYEGSNRENEIFSNLKAIDKIFEIDKSLNSIKDILKGYEFVKEVKVRNPNGAIADDEFIDYNFELIKSFVSEKNFLNSVEINVLYKRGYELIKTISENCINSSTIDIGDIKTFIITCGTIISTFAYSIQKGKGVETIRQMVANVYENLSKHLEEENTNKNNFKNEFLDKIQPMVRMR